MLFSHDVHCHSYFKQPAAGSLIDTVLFTSRRQASFLFCLQRPDLEEPMKAPIDTEPSISKLIDFISPTGGLAGSILTSYGTDILYSRSGVIVGYFRSLRMDENNRRRHYSSY